MHLPWTCACNCSISEVSLFLFQEFNNLLLPLGSVCSTKDSLVLQSSLLFSGAPTHPKYSGSPSVLWIRWDRNQFLGLFHTHTHKRCNTKCILHSSLPPHPKSHELGFFCHLHQTVLSWEMGYHSWNEMAFLIHFSVTGLGFEFAWVLKFLSWFLEVLIKALRTVYCC